MQQLGLPQSASEQASPSGRRVDIKLQTLGKGDPAGSDSEASDTDIPSISDSQHQQKVQPFLHSLRTIKVSASLHT